MDAFISYAQAADGVFAPALEQGLEMLAKPWTKRRALDIFRDSTGLSPTPHLWPDIRDALDAARWLVLLASPESAASRWVGKEIEHWLATKGPGRILIVLTGGACVWDEQDFDREASTAIHPALWSAFEHEPLYIDMSWARGQEQLTLDNARFRQNVAQIASPMHGLTPEDLESEAVRQERRLRRLARTAVAGLTVLACVATSFAVLFAGEARTVAEQRDAAIARALIADGERLAESDPELARRLALAAFRLAPTAESRANLLASLARPGLAVLGNGDGGSGAEVAFDPAGRTLTAGARIWDVTTRRPVGELALPRPEDGEPSLPDPSAFSFDGLTLATMDRDVRLWDARTRKQLGTLNVGGMDLAFSPTGPLLAVQVGDRAELWDATTRKRVRTVPHMLCTSVAFSPDGKRLITASEDRIVVWDVRTGKKIRTLRDIHYQGLVSLAVSPDGRTVATGAQLAHSGPADLRVRLWDIKSGELLADFDGHTGSVTSLAFSRDGGLLAAGSDDETVLVWDLATRRLAVPALTGHTDAVTSLDFGRGGLLASAQDTGEARLWDVSAGFTLRPGHTAGVDTAAFGPDGTLVTASTGVNGPRQGLPLDERDGNVRLWDTAARRAAGLIKVGGYDSVGGLAFARGGLLLVGADSGRVSTWNLATRQPAGPVMQAREGLTALAVNADATVLASSAHGTSVELWDLASGRPTGRPITTKTESLSSGSLAFSPTDRSLLAVLEAGDVVRLRDIVSGRVVFTLAGHAGPVTAVAFSSDGATIATGGADNTVRLWSAATGSPMGEPLAVSADVASLAFSPANGLLAAGDADGDVRLWDLRSRQPIGAAFPAHMFGVNTLAFSRDGRTLASGGDDTATRLWDLTYAVDPTRAICARAPRPLTGVQWTFYLPDVAYEPRLQAC